MADTLQYTSFGESCHHFGLSLNYRTLSRTENIRSSCAFDYLITLLLHVDDEHAHITCCQEGSTTDTGLIWLKYGPMSANYYDLSTQNTSSFSKAISVVLQGRPFTTL
jgi:hypothetical protein